jgi:hypothetical protein
MRLLPLFDDGAVFRSELGFRVLRCVHAGDIDVVEGLVVADPWDVDESAPLPAPDGRHRIDLAIACWDVATELAALRITFRDAKVVRWRRTKAKLATTDSATLAITDGGTAARLALALAEFAKRETFVESLVASMEDAPGGCGHVAIEGGTVFATSTGRDGGFATWLGLDGQGTPVCLVVDLATFDKGALRRWKPKHGAPPPRAFGPEFLAWLEVVGARFDEPLVSGPALDPAVVSELGRIAGEAAPLELLAYYEHATPLLAGTTLSTWLELMAALPERTRGVWWPVSLRDRRAGVVARSVDGEIVEVADFDGSGIYLSGPDLRTFFVNQALTAHGDEI